MPLYPALQMVWHHGTGLREETPTGSLSPSDKWPFGTEPGHQKPWLWLTFFLHGHDASETKFLEMLKSQTGEAPTSRSALIPGNMTRLGVFPNAFSPLLKLGASSWNVACQKQPHLSVAAACNMHRTSAFCRPIPFSVWQIAFHVPQ